MSFRRTRTRPARIVLAATIFLIITAVGQPAAQAYPPEPPPAGEAAELLAGLTVSAEGSDDGYDRELFPHWVTQEGECNTREVVLQRDGVDVETDSECRAVSGSWYSVYDATWYSSDDDIHIDHIVALSEAWHSGAGAWTTSRRREFANDLTRAQLIAVSASSNISKSNHDPAEWLPENENTWCVYGREWIWVKSVYDLTVDQAEKSALEDLLAGC